MLCVQVELNNRFLSTFHHMFDAAGGAVVSGELILEGNFKKLRHSIWECCTRSGNK